MSDIESDDFITIPGVSYGHSSGEQLPSQVLRRGSTIYLVHTAGKVASKSIWSALREHVQEPVYHLHYLKRKTLDNISQWAGEETSFDAEAMPALIDGRVINKLLEEHKDDFNWKVISLIRDPVAWQVSMLFELGAAVFPAVFKQDLFDAKTFHRMLVRALEKENSEALLNLKFYNSWWDREVMSVFGLDVLSSPFDQKKGYVINTKENVSMLVMQYERMSDVISQALYEFGLPSGIQLPHINRTAEKDLGPCDPKAFKKRFTLNEDQLTRIYGGRVVNHFYSPEKIKKFKATWSHEMQESKSYQFIFVVGMNRSGSTWSYNVTRSLVENYADNWECGYRGEGEELDQYIRDALSSGSKNLLKFHCPTKLVVELISTGQAKAIYTQRDLRDVAVSLVDFLNKPLAELLGDGTLDRIVTTHNAWTVQTKLCRLEYNAIMTTPEVEVRLIATYLHLAVSQDACARIADANNKNKMLKTLSSEKKSDTSSGWEFDEKSLLHKNHISDGTIRCFQKKLNEASIHELNSRYREFLVEEGYLSIEASRIMTSYSQNFEDVLLERVFRDKSDGFYIDVGAADPEFFSVTKHFYDKGWSGMNVEPILGLHQQLALRRPRDINLNLGVSDAEGVLEFYESGVSEFSGFVLASGKLAEEKLKQNEGLSYEVCVTTLSALYEQYGAGREVDFLKIDVEGWEKSVLEGWDADRLRPKVIMVEAIIPFKDLRDHIHNLDEMGTWHQWEQILIDGRYDFVCFDGLNRFYIRSESPELRDFFQVPVSPVHDPFVFCSTEKMTEQQKTLLPAVFTFQRSDDDNNGPDLIRQLEEKEACIQGQARQLQEKEQLIQNQARQLQARGGLTGKRRKG